MVSTAMYVASESVPFKRLNRYAISVGLLYWDLTGQRAQKMAGHTECIKPCSTTGIPGQPTNLAKMEDCLANCNAELDKSASSVGYRFLGAIGGGLLVAGVWLATRRR
jgi:hypothetical protein